MARNNSNFGLGTFILIFVIIFIIMSLSNPLGFNIDSILYFFTQAPTEILSDSNTVIGLFLLLILGFLIIILRDSSRNLRHFSFFLLPIGFIQEKGKNILDQVIDEGQGYNPFTFLIDSFNEIVIIIIIGFAIFMVMKMASGSKPR